MSSKIFNRQKILLKLIAELSKKNIRSKTFLIKSLFLLKEEYGFADKLNFYSFYPYKYGPFSLMCYHDLDILKQMDFLKDDEIHLTEKGKEFIGEINLNCQDEIEDIFKRFKNEATILEYVYSKYPLYTTKSELIGKKNKDKQTGYFTIGYEGKNIDSFLNILIKNNITMLIDVRNNPFSMNFSFVKNKLLQYLKKADIDYINIPELGIKKEQRKDLKNIDSYMQLFADYRKKLPEKKEYLEKIIHFGREKSIALMCFENDSSLCHRGEIASYLRNQNLEVIDL